MQQSPVLQKTALVMLLVAGSLAVVSPLHLAGALGAHSASYNGTAAGVAEAIIGVGLVLGAAALWRNGSAGCGLAIAATVFAIAGFILGISITARSGYVPDIAYHASVLPVLVGVLIVLRSAGRSQEAAR